MSDRWAKAEFPYGGPVYDDEEEELMLKAIKSGRFWAGQYTKSFEKELAKYLNVKHAVFCNSGSSALLLAITALNLPKGSKVVTQALNFPATVNVIVQNGLKPVFVDVELETLNVNPKTVQAAVIESRAKAYMHTHTIGNCPNMYDLTGLEVPFIEDSCDTMGSKFADRYLGTWGLMGCVSFHPAHQMTTGLGGAVVTNESIYAERLETLRDWGRIPQWKVEERFTKEGYDMRYYYPLKGYNLQAPEVCAAMGLAQLKKLTDFNRIRARNFNMLTDFFSKYQNKFIVPKVHPEAEISWFGYPVIIKDGWIKKFDLMKKFENSGIMTRSIYGGTIIHQPSYQNVEYDVYDTLENSEFLSNNAFWIGCYQGLNEEKTGNMIKRIKEIIR